MGLRQNLTRTFLWISVLAWGPLLGAKIFDLIVVVGAWSASPPETLRLLPYGPDHPVDTGDFFIPSSATLLFATFGALISGWTTPLAYRKWLFISLLMILTTLILTVVVFWPLNGALWAYASGSPKAIQDPTVLIKMAHDWVAFDWLRVSMATVGFVAATHALSTPYPQTRAKTSMIQNVIFGIFMLAVLMFLAYFVTAGL